MDEILKVFGVDWKLVLIQAVNFGLLLIILHRFLYKPVMKIIDKRAKKIEKGVRDSEEAEVKLNSAEKEKKAMLSLATKEAESIINSSRKRAEDVKSEILKEAEDKSSQILDETKQKAEEEKKKAVESSRAEIAKIAVLTAENILKEKERKIN